MECLETRLNDVKLIQPQIYGDDRGFFLETWRQNQYDELLNQNKKISFVQDNHCRSAPHVLRGLHLQHRYPQGKLVRVIAGQIYDVIVDLRKNSSTYGQWEGFYLSAENRHILWVPPGFAHGYYTMNDPIELLYKCTEYYHPEDEYTLIWNDPQLAIDWPLTNIVPLLSKKDEQGLTLEAIPIY
jgi:dTDP-4-dehydrorhamnose 3,5-epimerase